MGNTDKNKQFSYVCKKLGITDPSQQKRFHRYLNSPEYEDLSDTFSSKELLLVGKEFLENEGGVRIRTKK